MDLCNLKGDQKLESILWTFGTQVLGAKVWSNLLMCKIAEPFQNGGHLNYLLSNWFQKTYIFKNQLHQTNTGKSYRTSIFKLVHSLDDKMAAAKRTVTIKSSYFPNAVC